MSAVIHSTTRAAGAGNGWCPASQPRQPRMQRQKQLRVQCVAHVHSIRCVLVCTLGRGLCGVHRTASLAAVSTARGNACLDTIDPIISFSSKCGAPWLAAADVPTAARRPPLALQAQRGARCYGRGALIITALVVWEWHVWGRWCVHAQALRVHAEALRLAIAAARVQRCANPSHCSRASLHCTRRPGAALLASSGATDFKCWSRAF
jgi:hypothetical protein